jgi:ABC-2 type transport system ATP-binding protein
MASVIARGVSKRYGSNCALEEVDLTVAEGELRGLLGPNGAGKTTLLRILLGLVRADSGTVELLGRASVDSDRLDLDGVSGFVEEPSFYPYLSARANLELLAELDGHGSGAPVEELLDRVGLGERSADRVSGYSSGMRQRLGIAAALLRAPKLLLLDEPTSGLDPAGVRFIAELLRELSEQGVAVLLSSHQIGEVEGVCDAITVLNRGRVVWEGSAEQMRAQAPRPAYRMLTSDDRRALATAAEHPGVHAEPATDWGLAIEVDDRALDDYVLALARSGVSVRRLELASSSLESMFFALTEGS